MKSFFQHCSLCDAEVMLYEAQNTAVNVVVCRDALACNERVKEAGSTYYKHLKAELKQLETRRPELIKLIEAERIRLGLPDKTTVRHQVEMARIEMEG